ncbi:hypothetical protein [Methylobacterium sp. AMS5]|uniref:hypothetical protein n=1 Tax=Methylobacterium sp. AMS5 TaxID=925818 RepID=UPI00074F8892|nr:hypothetical protein [Methylobacterium sp. AMS5]AMB48431.1 hypothetical protein Y590_26010 [Methylobacterium sp. AMS5]
MRPKPQYSVPPRRPRLRLVHSRRELAFITSPPILDQAIAESTATTVMAERRRLGARVYAEDVVWHLRYRRGLTDPAAIERIALAACEVIVTRQHAAIAAHRRPKPPRRRTALRAECVQFELPFPEVRAAA